MPVDPSLRSLLAPSSVAVVGANDRPATFGGRAWAYLTRTSPDRAIPVNPRHRDVGGVPCVPRLLDVHPAPEAVVVAAPATAAMGVLEEAVATGVRAAVMLSRDLLGHEADIRAVVDGHPLTVLGPNCLGLINANDGVALSSSISLDRGWRPGPFALVSQSGALMGLLHAKSIDLGIGLGLAVSTGSQCMVRTEDVLAFLAADGRYRGVGLYIEDLDYGRFEAAMGRLRAAEITLVAVKGGLTPLGNAMAAAHSRALASNGRAFAQLARDLGAVVVDDPGQLLPTLAATTTRGRRWYVATLSGGLGAIAADEAARFGIELPEVPDAAMTAAGPGTGLTNPADLDATERSVPEKVAVIRALRDDASADGILVVVNDSPDMAELLRALRPECGTGGERALVVSECSSQMADAWADWTSTGTAVFPGLRSTLQALGRLHGAPRAVLGSTVWSGDVVPAVDLGPLLSDAGLPLLASCEVTNAGDALAAAQRFGYPVVLKASRPVHRGAHGVRVGLTEPAQVTAAFAELGEHGPVLVQPLAPAGLEWYVGVRMDPVFGELVLIGAGGPHLEALADVAIGRAPMRDEQLAALIASTNAARWVADGTSACLFDRAALIDVAKRAICAMATAVPPLESLDLNPVVISSSGAVIVDAKARRSTVGAALPSDP